MVISATRSWDHLSNKRCAALTLYLKNFGLGYCVCKRDEAIVTDPDPRTMGFAGDLIEPIEAQCACALVTA